MSERTGKVIVIGGGPAGLSAAQWCCELGLEAVLVEASNEVGGQLSSIHNPIDNFLGAAAANGRELLDRFTASLADRNFVRRLGEKAVELSTADLAVRIAGGEVLKADAIIVATGVRRRKLGIPGEDEFRGRGILESGAKNPAAVKGKRVLIVGGGDAAVENALILAEHAEKVTLVHRRGQFGARREFLDAARANRRIEFMTDATLGRICGRESVTSVVVDRSGGPIEVSAEAVLIRVGVEPATDLVKGKLELDDRGYIVIDSRCQTSVPGIFAAGDAANPLSPTISSAVGQGATSAKAAYDRIVTQNDRTTCQIDR